MGCIQSSLHHAATVVPANFLAEFLYDLIEKKSYPNDNSDELPTLLAYLEAFIIKIHPEQEQVNTISYFRTLSNRTDTYQLFNTAAKIMIRMNKSWLLNDHTLTFFSELSQRNHVLCDTLLEELSLLCTRDLLFLNSSHIDTVVASLLKRVDLPEDPFEFLDTIYDIGPIIQTLREEHGPALRETAIHNHLIHHDIPHALEIRLRTMHLLNDKMSLFIEDRTRNHFLHAVIGFMIEFHDYVQGNKGTFNSVEIATAHHINNWLIKSLNINAEHDLKKLILFMTDHIIILGTTMIFSPKKSMDLSQLYFMFKDKAIEANMYRALGASEEFARIIEICMLITGVCDKNVTAVDAVVQYQLSDKEVSSLPLVKNYLEKPLLLDRFFSQALFSSYSHNPQTITNSDKQCFLINLVPHLGMRAELGIKSKVEGVALAARAYINFISQCRPMLLIKDELSYSSWYMEEFAKQTMDKMIRTLFFSDPAIAGEISFSQSQTGCLQFVKDKLRLLAPPGREDAYALLIDPSVPETDALNFHAIKVFYDELSASERSQLISELLFVAVMQAGNAYSHRPGLDYERTRTIDTESNHTLGAYEPLFKPIRTPKSERLTPLVTPTPKWM